MGTSSSSRTARLSENPLNMHVGDTLETVLLSAFYDGCLRVWRSDGTPEVRLLEGEEAAAIVQALGRGVIARTGPEPNRYREVGLLDARGQLLCLPERMILKEGASSGHTGTRLCRATLTTRQGSMDISSWIEWGRWLSAVLLEATNRGEYIVIDKGGWERGGIPYALLGVFHDRETRVWTSLVEGNPAPSVEPWRVAKAGGGATVAAPANTETVGVAGILAAQAVASWAQTPLDVVLTFGTNPSGAWHPG